MDFQYSPTSRVGGTLHLSPSHLHNTDPAVVRNLRRSLSRSPSKHHLPVSKSPSRPLRLSATAPNTPRNLSTNRHHASMDDFHMPSAKKPRPTLRRTTPLNFPSQPNSASARPLHRALSDSSDNGNANLNPSTTPAASPSPDSESQENCDPSLSQESGGSGDEIFEKSPLAHFAAPPKALPAVTRAPAFRTAHRTWRPAKSSPLKRSDAVIAHPHQQPSSPSAKRRTICGGVVSSPFGTMPVDGDLSMSDRDTEDSDDAGHEDEDAPAAPGHPNRSFLPARPLTLRRTKPFVRSSDKSATPARRSLEISHESPRNPTKSTARPRPHLAAAFPAFLSSPARDDRTESGFADLNDINRSQHARPMRPQPHPLSKAMSPTTSPTPGSKDAVASPDKIFFQSPGPVPDFAKSLPIGALRPDAGHHQQQQQQQQQSSTAISYSRENSFEASFATPKLYHIAKPDPAAFRSTGLISKKHRNPDDIPPPPAAHAGMPDTPCKRVPGGFTFNTSPTPHNSAVKEQRLSQPAFGTPSKEFGLPSDATGARPRHNSDLFGSYLDFATSMRRENHNSIDSDNAVQSPQGKTDSQSSADELPPTPTKQTLGIVTINKENSLRSSLFGRRPSVGPSTFLAPEVPETEQTSSNSNITSRDTIVQPQTVASSNGSVPQTPIDNSVPDPSGLSISPNFRKAASPPIGNGSFPKPASLTPATPTHRDGYTAFGFNRPMMTPSNHTTFAQDLDPVLSRRFHKVEWYGRGNFSEVYKVSEAQEPVTVQSYFSSAHGSSSSQTPVPDKIFIVKKTKLPYTSIKVRQRKLREAAIMAALGRNDHTVQLINSWESSGHIYIQTEFCEEGSLEQFLAKIGNKGRLDDFRIWKILIELGEGLKHIHDHGFIHVDLKPANVFIDFAGVLKIGDFGLATEWPAPKNVEGEGDRRYIGPDLLQGAFDKPADIFALGMIMFEIAGNCELPDNGTYWHHLRSGNWSDLPSLTSTSTNSLSHASGNDTSSWTPSQSFSRSNTQNPSFYSQAPGSQSFDGNLKSISQSAKATKCIVEAPRFMQDPEAPESLEHVVHWMMQPKPGDRPVVDQILQAGGCRWVDARRRAGAVVFEGPWGPPNHVLASYEQSQEDHEMLDVS